MIALSIGQKPWQEEAGQPAFCLRQYQMRVALRHGEKPFMSYQAIHFTRPAIIYRFRPRGVAEHV